MNIVVTPEPDGIALEEADDFRAFAVTAPRSLADDLAAHVRPVGRYDGEHVWVDREALAGLAGARADDPAWQEGLAAMVDFARDKGFLSEDGAAIRAHVEWADG